MRSDATIFRPGLSQKVTTSGVSAATASGFSAQIYAVRVHATAAAYIKFGASPTATASDIFMPGGVTEYFTVSPGEKLAAIQDSAAGVVHVTELTH